MNRDTYQKTQSRLRDLRSKLRFMTIAMQTDMVGRKNLSGHVLTAKHAFYEVTAEYDPDRRALIAEITALEATL